jgi:putative CocE/NonD family hydrolase
MNVRVPPITSLLGTSLLAGLLAGCAPASDRAGQAGIGAAYAKSEHLVEMRDGTELYVAVYRPRDESQSYPIMLRRTPYSCRPYGESRYPDQVGPSEYMEDEGYIFVCGDVRGRYMSEGTYDNMRPHVPGNEGIDESSDTYDTIEWLVENIPGNNGKVGMWGISYPGFYTAAALPEAHPALVASSPQAPISDFFFDDFHHHGAYLLSYFLITPVFGYHKEGPTPREWYPTVRPHTPDGYKLYMDLGPLSNADRYYGEDNFFWQQLVEHPNYDAFWQDRNLLPHLDDVDHAVMTVGGLFDAEDLYGPLNIYRTLESENPGITNLLVMGPWGHGDWARTVETQMVGDIAFGDSISHYYQREVEAPFFRYFLKGEGGPPDFEALFFDTGRKEWRELDVWPPEEAVASRLFLGANETLSLGAPPPPSQAHTEYVSDPREPVPYTEDIRVVFTPRRYMSEDQRFAERRPDVIEFQTDVLEEDLTLVGDLRTHLEVSTTGTDADWIVKLIDVYPDDYPNDEHTPDHVRLAGYQQMVRSEVMRGRFRNSYEKPEPFVPGEVTPVRIPLQDVFHTFRRGHRIMVQIQSTWFPLIDRNPQTFVDNIFKAVEEDFVAATHRVYHSPEHASYLELRILR